MSGIGSDFVEIHDVVPRWFGSAGSNFRCDRQGTMLVNALVGGAKILLAFDNIWYNPAMRDCILSLGQLMDIGRHADCYPHKAFLNEYSGGPPLAEFNRRPPQQPQWSMVLSDEAVDGNLADEAEHALTHAPAAGHPFILSLIHI